MGKYGNKYFREVLSNELKINKLGVNIHCKEDGIYLVLPPNSLLHEEYGIIPKLVDRVNTISKSFKVKVKLEETIYSDTNNTKLKLNVLDD